LAGIVLLALLCRQAVAYSHAHSGDAPAPITRSDRAWLFAALGLVWLQIALGGWVSTNYAVLACTEFPGCQGSWWPAMNFNEGFELWRELGKTGAGEYLSFAALTAIHYAHRLLAYAVFIVLGWLAFRLLQLVPLRRQGRWLAVLALLQFFTGLSNVVLDWPIVAAVLHTGGAAALAVVLTWAACESRADPAAQARLKPRGLSA
jgi:heme a synthase